MAVRSRFGWMGKTRRRTVQQSAPMLRDIYSLPVLSRAARLAGSYTYLAVWLGITRQAVWEWNRYQRVPRSYWPIIERLTGGMCTVADFEAEYGE